MNDFINIVIPMAGAGSRFKANGINIPKPLIPILGRPMVEIVIKNLMPSRPHRFIFVCQRAHVIEFDLQSKLETWAPGCEVVKIDGLSDGAACTVLSCRELIDNSSSLMIANSDQYIDIDINDYLNVADDEGCDGLIMTMSASDPKWSFVRFSNSHKVIEVVEKVPVSNVATVGIYSFKQGREFVNAADSMIKKNLRVNGEFYVAPTYNELIANGHTINVFNIGSEMKGMFGLGTPEDLEKFLAHPASKNMANLR